MRLYLLRHGQSTHNIGADSDNPDPPLTVLGAQQAARAAAFLAETLPEAVALYASPQRRALQTVAPLQRALGLPTHIVPDLCESGGLYHHSGMTRSAILAEWPHVLPDPRIGEYGWWPAGETEADEAQVYTRAERAIAYLRVRHEAAGETVIAVTHGRYCGVLISALLGLGPTGYTRFPMENCAVTRIDFVPFPQVAAYTPPTPLTRAVRLRYHNHTGHLPADWVT